MSLAEEFDVMEPEPKAPDPNAALQSSYDESRRNTFNGQTLKPWTIYRHSLALSLGCQLIRGASPFLADFLIKASYPNDFRDVIIVLWVSHLTPMEVMGWDGANDPAGAMRAAYDWAESIHFEYGSAAYQAGLALLDRILKQVLSAFFETAHAGGDKKKATTDPPGNSSSPSPPQGPADTPSPTS